MDTRSLQIAVAYPRALSFAASIVAAADRLGLDPAWLANVINFESGFNPAAKNPYSSATGLIQFMEPTAARLGTTTAVLRTLSAIDQMPFVERYFGFYKGRLKSQGDVYAAVFYPAAIGKGADYAFSAAVQRVNPGIKTMGDYANKASLKAKLTDVGRSGGTALTVKPGANVAGAAGRSTWLLWTLAAGLTGLLVWRLRRKRGPA